MRENKGQDCRGQGVLRHMAVGKAGRRIRKGAVFMIGCCMFLGSTKLTALAVPWEPDTETAGCLRTRNADWEADGLIAETDREDRVELLAEETEGHRHTPEDHDTGWTAWADSAALPNDGGNYYLTVDVELTALWTVAGNTAVNLCLNGHTVQQTKTATGVIKVNGEGAELSVFDCSEGMAGTITGGKGSSTNGGGITVSTGGSLNLYGGRITGNSGTSGGGIYVGAGSSAVMHGGEISGNTVTTNGGGVYVTGSGSELTITGGTIGSNTATGTSGKGGGVHAAAGGAVHMTGGEIRENAAVSGGGVYMTGTTTSYLMKGGIVRSNTATGTGGKGGGLYVANGAADMTGGEIRENTAVSGGGVYITGTSSSYTLNGGSVIGNTVTADGGGIYAVSSSTPMITGGTVSGNKAAGKGAGIYAATTKLGITGGTIAGNEAESEGGGIFYGSNVTFSGGAVYANTAAGAVNNLAATSTTYTASLEGGLILGGLGGKGKYNHSSETYPMYPGEITGILGDEITSGDASMAAIAGARPGDILYADPAKEITSTADGKLYRGIYFPPSEENGTGSWVFRWVPDIGTTFTVTYETNGGAIENADSYTKYTYGTELALPTGQAITREGYEFLGWYETADFTGSPVIALAADSLFDDVPVFYAKWRERHACVDCAEAHDAIENWIPWENSAGLPEHTKLPESGGNYYLIADVNLADVWAAAKGTTVNLCLNGHTIRQTKEGAGVISVIGTGTELAVFDCSAGMAGRITGGKVTSTTAGGGITVGGTAGSGSLKLYGGRITGNEAPNGGGIFVTGTSSTLLVDGGIIESNTAAGTTSTTGRGGGIYAANGSVVLSGGEITGNQGNQGGGLGVGGGSVEMTGGMVTGNTANQGGGVYTTGSTAKFTMNGGNIADNTTAGNGGGLHAASSSTPIINGGAVSGNKAAGNGGGIYGATTKMQIMGGTISGNVSEGDGGGIFYGGNFTMSGGAVYANTAGGAVDNLAAASATYTASLEGGLILGGLGGKGKYQYGSETYPMYSGEITGTLGGEIISKEGEVPEASVIGARAGDILYADPAKEITSAADGKIYKGIYLEPAEPDGIGTWSFRWVPYIGAKYTITYETGGGIVKNEEKYTEYTYGTELTLPTEQEVSRAGYVFLGWYESADFAGDPVTSIAADALLDGNPVFYAKWKEGHAGINCPEEHDAGGEWQESNSTQLPTEAGNYFLIADVELTAAWTVPEGVFHLCLNGHTVRQTKSYRVIMVGSTSELGLFDCSAQQTGKVSGGKITSGSGAGIYVQGGKLKLYGGTVCENSYAGTSTTSGGGGVSVDNGIMEFHGGVIRGNKARSGGGVFITNNAELRMRGGSITGNVENNSGTQITNGGGIYVASGLAEVSGGSIEGNQAGNGGGVYAAGGSVELTGGSIRDNQADTGGGIYVGGGGQLQVSGGQLNGNTAVNNGGGIYSKGTSSARNGQITMTGGSVYANTAGNGAGIYYDSYSTISLAGGLILGSLEGAARNVTCNYGTETYPMYSGVVAGTVGDTVTDGTNTVPGVKADDILTASRASGITIGSVSQGQLYTGVYMESEDGIWQFQLPSAGVILNKSKAELDYPENVTIQLTAVVTDTSGGDTTVTWRSSDDTVAAVAEDGMVTAQKTGTATITAETGSGMTADCEITVSGSVYTVTYHTNGGTVTAEGGIDTGSYTYGTGLKLPEAVTKEGYTFGGWFADGACTGNPVTEISGTETGDKEFYAGWTEDTPVETPSPVPSSSPTPSPSPEPTASPGPTPGPTPNPGPTPGLSPEPSAEPSAGPGGSPEPNPGETSNPEWNIHGGQQTVEGDIWVRQPVIEVELPGNLDFGINPFQLAVNAGGEDTVPVTDQIISGEYYVTNYSNVAVAVTAATFVSAANEKIELVAKDDVVWDTNTNEIRSSAAAGRRAVWLVQLYPVDIAVSDTGCSMTVTGITAGTTTGIDVEGDTLTRGTGAEDVEKKPVFVLAAWDGSSNAAKKASVAGFQFGGAVEPNADFEDGDIMVTTVFELKTLTVNQMNGNYEEYKTADNISGFCSTIKQEKTAAEP